MAKKQEITAATAVVVDKLADSAQHAKRTDVVSDSGNKYRVSIRKSDGRWVCSCRGWTNVCNKKGSDCKHIKALKAFGDSGVLEQILGSLRNVITMAKSGKSEAMRVWQEIRTKVDMATAYLEAKGESAEIEQLVLQAKEGLSAL